MNTLHNKTYKRIKHILDKKDGFYMVIRFKPDCKYHFNPKRKLNGHFKYDSLSKVQDNICYNLNHLIRNTINQENKPKAISRQHEHTPKFKYNETQSLELWEAIDYQNLNWDDEIGDMPHSAIKYFGVLESTSLLSNTKYLNDPLPNQTHLGYHIHLFFINDSHLTPDNFRQHLMGAIGVKESSPLLTWIKEIQSTTTPIGFKEIINKAEFAKYHIKQLNSPTKIISNYSFGLH